MGSEDHPPHRVVQLEAGEIDRVEGLWKEMVAHHRRAVGSEWPVRDEGAAWERRRAEYAEWLARGDGRMFAAVAAEDAQAPPAGYALLSTRAAGATWDMGERVGELESLAVAAPLRGQGIGTLLIDHCRELLRAEGIAYWGVAVVAANEDAGKLYERAGFRPYYEHLRARI